MMVPKQIAEISHHMTPKTMASFLLYEINNNNASENLQRRYKGAIKVLYDFLPDDKNVTKERLLEWRKSMESNGYASITILNYVKYINRYLDYVGCSEIRFNKGKAKDIAGMNFGYLTAIEPTGEKHRGDYVWLFECKCGNTVELPATRALLGNTLSCGCLKGEALKASRKYYDGTSIVQSMTEKVESTRSSSGYTGVSPKRDKWQAHITYKGIRYSLGSYFDINDAVKARARAKEIVIADAQGLLDFYTELEKTFSQLPNRRTEPKKKFTSTEWTVNNTPGSAARRSDNKSGYSGVNYRDNKWEAKICYNGLRYMLGRFNDIQDAIAIRKKAEFDLKKYPDVFEKEYKIRFSHYFIKEKRK